jgi:transcriptional regulator with XRE-family HTH domain
MADLRKRFGKLVAAHRRRCGMTQAQLAEAADLSPTMIVRIEGGTSGARFPSIERISAALQVDPAELFVVGSSRQGRVRPVMSEINARLTGLSDHDLQWVDDLLDVALRSKA